MQLGEVNDDWQVISLGGSLYNIKNTGRGNFMEWYSSKDNWSTYNSSSAATDDQFQLSFYVIGKGVLNDGAENEGGNQGGTVTPPAGGDQGGSDVEMVAAATITFDDTAKRTVFNSNQQVWMENGITVTNNKAASTSPIGDYAKPVRFYKSTDVIIEYPQMTRITFDVAFSDRVAGLADTLKATEGVTVTVDGLVVTADFDSAVDSLTLTKLVNQTRISSITVYTAA
jgi:hypothetical protein